MFVQAPLRMHEKLSWILGELSKSAAADGESATHAVSEPSIMPNPTPEMRAQHEQNLIAMSRLRNIHMGMQIWAQESDEPIRNLQQLVDAGMLQSHDIKSPLGPAQDGKDYWLDFARINPADGDWSKRVVGVDRAMYERVGNVATLFADGHIELLTLARFHALLEDQVNEDVTPDLPNRREAAGVRGWERHTFAHADAQELGQLLLEALGDDVEIAIDPRTNTLMVSASELRLPPWIALLDRLDTAPERD
jgi:hypothetical protein